VGTGREGHQAEAGRWCLRQDRWIENQAGSSIRNVVRAARHYDTIEIQARRYTIAAGPLPDNLRHALEPITSSSRLAH
jgi:hypothetical protein